MSGADRAVGACDTHDSDEAGIAHCVETVNNVVRADGDDGADSKDSKDDANSSDAVGNIGGIDDESNAHVKNYADGEHYEDCLHSGNVGTVRTIDKNCHVGCRKFEDIKDHIWCVDRSAEKHLLWP